MDACEIEGRWWIHGPGEPAQFGILSRDHDGGLSLTVKIPQSLSADAVALQFSDTRTEDSVPSVIVGRDANDKPVTLFGCRALRGWSSGMRRYNVHVLAAVQGLELESWSQQCIRAVNLDIDLLHKWLGAKILEATKAADGRPVYQTPPVEEILVDVSPGVQLRIVRFITYSSALDEYNFQPAHQFWLHFDTAQSIGQISDWWVPWVTRLLSLLVGNPVRCSKTELFIQDPYAADAEGFPNPGTVIRRGKDDAPNAKNVHTFEMLAPYPSIANDFEAVVRNWFRMASELEPVIDLFSTVAFHSHLHSDAEFLFLVQAVEVYHARVFGSKALSKEEHVRRVEAVVSGAPAEVRDWARQKLQGANYKYLDERLTEVFERHKDEADKLFANIAELPERIRYTRNHLTHYTGDTTSPKYLKPAEMVEVAWYLRIFIWICLLKEIGISGNAIERLIKRYGDADFVNLQ
jgi:hypothetical protein